MRTGFLFTLGDALQDIVRFDIELDEDGYIVTDEYMRTNIPGVYAAGDIRSKQVRQIAPAVSGGAPLILNGLLSVMSVAIIRFPGSNCESEAIGIKAT